MFRIARSIARRIWTTYSGVPPDPGVRVQLGHENMGEAVEVEGVPPDPGVRVQLAQRYLHGHGIEVGALHQPLPVPASVHVHYVDRMGVPDLRRHYPELAGERLIPVDLIDDGERLTRVPDGSQDFVIANHFLEHCEDPIGAVQAFLRVLRPGGVLYAAVPDKRFTFDAPRRVTPLQHLWDDHRSGAETSRQAHYLDFVRAVHGTDNEGDAQRLADDYMGRGYSIHYHVWTQRELIELFLDLQRSLPIEFEAIQKNEIELIVVVRKRMPDEPETHVVEDAN